MTVFRSLLVALKAAVLDVFSIGAAYGVVVAIFQWGRGRALVGVGENVPIESYVPMIMFAIVFGLSMDYEVFLLSRVKETWDAHHDHGVAVASGLAATGRAITCAALIMARVFAAFVASTDVVIKMLAVGLAASVLIDATVVRLVLVPAAMNRLGPSCWWLPRWLDRVLPHVEAEGTDGSEGVGGSASCPPGYELSTVTASVTPWPGKVICSTSTWTGPRRSWSTSPAAVDEELVSAKPVARSAAT